MAAPHEPLRATPSIVLDPSELAEDFVRASGPGGQNVNKLSTAVALRFDVGASPNLPDDVKARLLASAKHLATSEGVLVIKAQRFRTQDRNRQDARERLAALIAAAAVRPKPRKATKPTYASKLRRMDAKAKRGAVKAGRGRVTFD